jgi:hypothetical protein
MANAVSSRALVCLRKRRFISFLSKKAAAVSAAAVSSQAGLGEETHAISSTQNKDSNKPALNVEPVWFVVKSLVNTVAHVKFPSAVAVPLLTALENWL